jgi:hypothetical protein
MVSWVTGLWVVFCSFCLQSGLQLGPEVTHCQFMQFGQSCCCFCQAAAAFSYSCNSVWSNPLPARFSFENCPQSHETSSAIHHGPIWVVGFSPHICSQAFVPCLAFVG